MTGTPLRDAMSEIICSMHVPPEGGNSVVVLHDWVRTGRTEEVCAVCEGHREVPASYPVRATEQRNAEQQSQVWRNWQEAKEQRDTAVAELTRMREQRDAFKGKNRDLQQRLMELQERLMEMTKDYHRRNDATPKMMYDNQDRYAEVLQKTQIAASVPVRLPARDAFPRKTSPLLLAALVMATPVLMSVLVYFVQCNVLGECR